MVPSKWSYFQVSGAMVTRASGTHAGLVEDDAISSASHEDRRKSCELAKCISRSMWVATERNTCFDTKCGITNTVSCNVIQV